MSCPPYCTYMWCRVTLVLCCVHATPPIYIPATTLIHYVKDFKFNQITLAPIISSRSWIQFSKFIQCKSMPSTAASCVPMTACMHANLPVREWFVQLDNVSIQYSISYNSLCLHDSFHASMQAGCQHFYMEPRCVGHF